MAVILTRGIHSFNRESETVTPDGRKTSLRVASMPVENTPVETNESTSGGAPAANQNHEDAFSQALNASQETSPEAAGTPAPAATSQAPAVPPAPNFREFATKSGLQADQFKTDQELFEALLAERKQLQPLANLGRQYAPHISEFDKFLQSQQQAQAAAPAAQDSDPNAFDAKKHFEEKWGAPKWDPQWDFFTKKNMLTRDEETGLLVAAPGYEAMVAPHLQKINDALERQSEQHLKLFRGNPYEAIHEALSPAFRHEMLALIREEMGQDRSQQQQMTEMDRFEQQYSSVLFTKDLAGNQAMTPVGEKLIGYAQQMVSRGFAEHEALNMAAEMMGLQAQASPASAAQPAVPQTPEQISAQKQESFIENAKKRAAHAPSASAYSPTNTPNAPFVTDESELDSMFSNALAQRG